MTIVFPRYLKRSNRERRVMSSVKKGWKSSLPHLSTTWARIFPRHRYFLSAHYLGQDIP
jgi:hypothetical protein